MLLLFESLFIKFILSSAFPLQRHQPFFYLFTFKRRQLFYLFTFLPLKRFFTFRFSHFPLIGVSLFLPFYLFTFLPLKLLFYL